MTSLMTDGSVPARMDKSKDLWQSVVLGGLLLCRLASSVQLCMIWLKMKTSQMWMTAWTMMTTEWLFLVSVDHRCLKSTSRLFEVGMERVQQALCWGVSHGC